MYCDAKEIRFRNREELTLKSKAKTFLIDILKLLVYSNTRGSVKYGRKEKNRRALPFYDAKFYG